MSPRHCAAISALRSCCFNRRAGQSHKDNVRCTAVEEQPEAKEVQLSQPSSTSLLVISSGLTSGLSSTSLLSISPGTLIPRIQWQPLLTNATDRVQQWPLAVKPRSEFSDRRATASVLAGTVSQAHTIVGKIQGDGRKFLQRFKSYFG